MEFKDHKHIELDRSGDRLTVTMKNEGRSVFKVDLIDEYREIQNSLKHLEDAPQWVLVQSADKKAFSYGGDIEHFADCIENGRHNDLHSYGRKCIEVLLANSDGMDCDAITVGIVEGDALGGGFEVLMSFDFVVAHPDARFGLPEAQFGLFAGMGAHAFLSRQIGTARAARMINEGAIHSAKEMHELGIVTHIAEDGDVAAAVERLIRQKSKRINGHLGSRQAMRRAAPVSREELMEIVSIWTNAAMNLSAHNLRHIQQIVKRQKSSGVKPDQTPKNDPIITQIPLAAAKSV